MYDRDPKCVFVADTLAESHSVVAFLGANGIDAQVMNELTLGGFEGLTAWLPGKASLRGLEVWVTDPATADSARKLIAENEATLQRAEASRALRTEPISATCEECGRTAVFPPADQGTVQDCPHCRAFIDVPDADEENNESGVDFEEESAQPEE